jgi:molybdopterin-guanine dinucleotide biosynthesis protein A
MKLADRNITGILLAGGKSSRMGKEKGSLVIGGKMLYEYPLRVLESFCEEILISSCNDEERDYGYRVVCDEVEGLGPLGGIQTCLKHSRNDWNLVLSYDMPLVSKGLVGFLIDHADDMDLVIPGLEPDRPEPLCALYRKSLIDTIQSQIDRKHYAVHGLIPLVRSRFVPITPGMPFFRPDLFLNINRHSDLRNFSGALNHED